MIKVRSIWLRRAEGTIRECEKPFGERAVLTFAEANCVLLDWSRTAPEEGNGYHKCDFIVTYADGETYQGRYDLTKGERISVQDHMRRHIEFSAGLKKPAHITEEQYRAYLSDIVGDKVESYRKFHQTYALDD